MLRWKVVGLVAPVIAMFAASEADAQTRYYAREKLAVVAPVYTYEASYGDYGPCSNDVRTANLNGCTRSDGRSVAGSFCSPQTKTVACAARTSCPSLVNRKTASADDGNARTIVELGSSSTFESAMARCNSWLNGRKLPGVCFYYNDRNGTTRYSYGGGTYLRDAPDEPTNWASYCS